MHIRKKTLRFMVLVLCIAFLMTTLSACQMSDRLVERTLQLVLSSDSENKDKDDLDDENEDIDADGDNDEEQDIVIEEMSADEIFAFVSKQVLLDAVEKSAQIGSAQLNILTTPGVQVGSEDSEYKKISTNISNPEEGENISIIMESINDSTTGDASMTMELQSGSETASRGGIFFKGNNMLIQKADIEIPLIQYTMDENVSKSYAGISAIDRYNRVLIDASEVHMDSDEWGDAIDVYLESLEQSVEKEDYSLSKKEIDIADTREEVDEVTLTLTGENATLVLKEYISLMAKDSSLASYFVSPNHANEDATDYEITGFDGVLRDIDALSDEERSDMSVTFVAQTGSEVSSLSLSAMTGSKMMGLYFKFYEDGYIRDHEINFSGFDGSIVKMTELNVSVGEDQYSGSILYENAAPGGILQESSSVYSDSTITGDQYNSSIQLRYVNAGSTEGASSDISGELEYTQQKINDEITGTLEGAIYLFAEGETTTMNISVQIEENNDVHEVSPPQFIEGSGISAYDQESLFMALDNEFYIDNYKRAPVSTRTVAALIMILY